ncbi:S8 family peptidase [Sporobolomyces koalae]|uniref:S8 family peptidase n=1 Tax=Sporobolomyces koalae TaxID=500713 RepID=UPI003181090D
MLTTLLSAACLAYSATANPLPPNAAGLLPQGFQLAPLYTPPPPPASSAASFSPYEVDSHIVRDSYLVVLEDNLAAPEIEAHHAQVEAVHEADSRLRLLKADDADANASRSSRKHHGVKHRFHIGGNKHGHRRHAHMSKQLKGYTGSFSESTLDAIRAMKGVKYVERDSLVHTMELEKMAPWGLARISHRNTLTLGTFNKYEYEDSAGEGVDAYVIDTGVNIDHVELEGRAKWGKTIPNDPDQDLNGHGSHVAGTIASRKYGVAKKANIIAVKVLGAGGSGTMADVVAGVAWAADSAAEQAALKVQGKNSKHKGSVANMSLGGGKSQALDDAVDAAVEDGLHFAVAAGNDNRDACAYSPAASKNAITVGASTIADERAYFSNFGRCVDIFSPGLDILSIWNSGPRSTNKISGTSMASPHIAGLAAYMLSTDWAKNAAFADAQELLESTPGYKQLFFGTRNAPVPKEPVVSPKTLKKAMIKVATKGILSGDIGSGSPNLLSFNNYTTSAHSAASPSHNSIMESALVESYLEELKEELATLRSEIRHEVDEMTELVHELVN